MVLLVVAFSAVAQNCLDAIIGFESQGAPLTKFVEKAEAETNARFFYKDNWVNSITITVSTKGKSLRWIVDKVIAGYGLTYIVFQERNIIFIPQGFTVDNDKLTEGMVGYVRVIGNLMEKAATKRTRLKA